MPPDLPSALYQNKPQSHLPKGLFSSKFVSSDPPIDGILRAPVTSSRPVWRESRYQSQKSSTITSSIYTFCCNASISSPHFVLTNFSKTVQQLSHDLVYDAHAQPLIGSLLYPQQLFSSLAISRARPFSFKNCSLSCLISRACCSLSQRRWLFKRQTRFSASMLSKFGQFLSSWKFILAREAKHFSSSRFSENSCARITNSTELCFCKRRSSQREVSLLIWYSRDNSKRLLTSCWSEICRGNGYIIHSNS